MTSTSGPTHHPGGKALWPLALLALLATCLWLLHRLAAGHPLFGHGPVHDGLRVGATLATALLAVLAGGRAILRLGLSNGLGLEPTGLQRAIAYSVLTFAASAVVLASFGFDVTAVLTTSAILTAAVGLAMQPTLGSLVSGVALHLDRVLHVGDTIVLDGRPVEITQLDWRTVVGRRRDGTVVVVPNARVSNETLVVHPAGQPARHDTVFPAPAMLPPQQVTDLASDLITDFPQVDASFPVMVMVEAHEPEHALVRYKARYWVRNVWDRPEVSSEVLRRLWYAFQRQGIVWPISRLYEADLRVSRLGDLAVGGCSLVQAVGSALEASTLRHDAQTASRLAAGGELLLYAPDERIVLPSRCVGHTFLQVSGGTRVAPDAGMLADAVASPQLLKIQQLSQTARLKRLSDTLARYIGPYAGHAVRQAAVRTASFADLCQELAGEIEDPHEQERFLAEIDCAEGPLFGPGRVFSARRDATGRLAADPPMRAVDEVAILAVPAGLANLLADHIPDETTCTPIARLDAGPSPHSDGEFLRGQREAIHL